MNLSSHRQSTNIDLTGKVILITGAAGRLGSEAAIHSFSAGATVVLTDINESTLAELHQYLSETDGQRVFSFAEDLTSDDGLDNLFMYIRSLPTPYTELYIAHIPVLKVGVQLLKTSLQHIYFMISIPN